MHRASQAVAPTPGNFRLGVDFTTPFQTAWQGVGANYALIAAMSAYGLSAPQIATEWDRVSRSGVKTVTTWCDQSWSMPSYPSGSPDWTSTAMTGFYAGVQAMKDAGIKVFIRAGWHFPQNVGALSGAAPITPTAPQEAIYASWVSELANQLINVRGFTNVVGLMFFTEPTTQLGTIPGGYASPQEYYAHVVTVARDKIVADDAGRTPLRSLLTLMGPHEQSFTNDTWTEYLKANVPTLLDTYGAHSYVNNPAFPPLSQNEVAAGNYQNWINLFANWSGDASPKPFVADEGGFIVGLDTDSTGYRATSDCGWQWVRLIDGHMQAGAAASYIWLLADQPILGAVLQYGTYRWAADSSAVKPSFQAISMHANLTGGGGGTSLYRATGGDAAIHATGVFVPFGVKNTVNPAGEYSIVVINEGPAVDVGVDLRGISLSGRTLYRYVYSGEAPPVAAADPAYLVPWDRSFTGITTAIPSTRHPGHSIVIYSTMNIQAPADATNHALTATVTTDSTGYGAAANVAKGNPSNVLDTRNGWAKADNASHWLMYEWQSSKAIGRVELAFVGTTTGKVYATWLDTSSPSPLADYTIEYWNGSSWVQVASVTGNAQANRTHTFGPVSATKLRINVTSAAATAKLNNFAAYAA